MSFELNPVQGYVSELETELKLAPNHEREEFVVEEIKKAIDHIITAMQGYLSVSCNGNLNPISGETGEEVNIKIVSLSPPAGIPVPIPVETEIPPVGEQPKAGEPLTPAEVEKTVESTQQEIAPVGENVQPPVITENPTEPIPPATSESNLENPSVAPASHPEPESWASDE